MSKINWKEMYADMYEKRFKEASRSTEAPISRLEFGMTELQKLVQYRRMKLITSKEYNDRRRAIEKQLIGI